MKERYPLIPLCGQRQNVGTPVAVEITDDRRQRARLRSEDVASAAAAAQPFVPRQAASEIAELADHDVSDPISVEIDVRGVHRPLQAIDPPGDRRIGARAPRGNQAEGTEPSVVRLELSHQQDAERVAKELEMGNG